MPELPEVESVKVGLNQLVQGKVIEDVTVYWPRIIDTESDLHLWIQQLKGRSIEKIGRRGKYLIFFLEDQVMVSHLRMEGKYLYFPSQELPERKDKHSHVIFHFKDGSQLHYHDVRKFGRMRLTTRENYEEYFETKKLGPEPLTGHFKWESFHQRLQLTKRPIKTVLLEQKVVVGLGNIYVDEALFEAGILPMRLANRLNEEETKKLHQAIQEVLARAVEAGGSTIRTYKNSLGQAGNFQLKLKVYGRKNQPCVVCGQPIQKMSLGQRGTHFCLNCQS